MRLVEAQEVVMSVNRTDRKRVLGIVGSPRRGGNTDILVDEVLAGAEEVGALTGKVILSDLEIAPCRACDEKCPYHLPIREMIEENVAFYESLRS